MFQCAHLIISLLVSCNKFTKPHDAERIAPDPRASLGSVPDLLGASELLALLDHVGEPVGAAVEVEDEAQRGVGHLLHAVPSYIANSNTQLSCRLKK